MRRNGNSRNGRKRDRGPELPDFDTLRTLHRNDPQALERLRHDLTRQVVDSAPSSARRRLEGLQFRINMELERAGSAEARYRRLSHMMYESFAELNQCLNNPSEALRQRREATDHSAKVIPLDPRHKSH